MQKKKHSFAKVSSRSDVAGMNGRLHSNGIILLLLLLAVAIASSGSSSDRQFIFVYSSDCQQCNELKPFAMEAAQMMDAKFVEGDFSRNVPFPGYVLLLDGKVTISGFNSEEVLFQSLCDLTGNAKACSRYDQVKSITEQTVQQ